MLSTFFSWATAQTHCKAQEEVVFSCQMQNSKKVASLCATSRVIKGSKKVVTLHYRFGKLSAPEFQFPSSNIGSLERFKLRHYFRPGLDATTISFKNGTFDYSIYDTQESELSNGGKREEVRTTGLSVSSSAKNKGAELTCDEASLATGWSIIDGVVPCEEEDGVPNTCQYDGP